MTVPPLALLMLITMPPSLAAQTSTNQTLVDPRPSDARMNQFEDVRGESWKVFAIDSFADGPLGVTEVQEVRQQNPPSTWVVFVKNRSLMPVSSYAMAAAIVTSDGNVKAIQRLPVIKNLEPGKISRQGMRVTVSVLMPTDRVVFFADEISSELGQWRTSTADISTMIKRAAARLPVP